MCIESMDVKRSREEVRPRACLRLKCTKWRRMKCLGNEREKLVKKWRVNRTTARKSCRHTRTLTHLTRSVCMGRSSSVLQTAVSLGCPSLRNRLCSCRRGLQI
ncbi:hypothetical protein ANANG_G00144970 [Anguilla anguilla]|uniref:Uncharacterized protein n=1 Tax=Anguilla anguilla TaxID=7936 RepID=A0A9D3MBJ0_ANGAN|nr:hypothetical protein ANANG_G00144970 [Anguilla anguilla]